MQLLKDRIVNEGRVLPGNVLKVDGFLNQRMDIDLLNALGAEWRARYEGENITKILTIEASGIGIACIAAQHFGVPVVFAKKTKSMPGLDQLDSKVVSYTHGGVYNVVVPSAFISADDRVLIIDDFLANGSALEALIKICRKAGATVVGAGVAVEKAFQGGG